MGSADVTSGRVLAARTSIAAPAQSRAKTVGDSAGGRLLRVDDGGGPLLLHLGPSVDVGSTSRDAVDVGHTRAKPLGRLFDFVVALVVLVLTSPVILASAIVIRLTSPGPAVFRQARIGEGGEPFTMLKLRTMYRESDPATDAANRDMCRREIEHPDCPAGTSDGIYKLESDPRITPVGRVLRALSIDELPQLVNVIRGEMAIVGPRPLLPMEFEWCSARQRQRSLVKPGLTGLWQVRGRNRLSMGQMLELDVEYARERSWSVDLGILVRTLGILLRREGAR